jgi:hypothetical protein
MSTKDAAYRLAHRYPGGVEALAARMRVNPNTLQHKLNPNAPGHHLYLEDAEAMTAFTGDPDIAQAMALACNHVCIPVAPLAMKAGGELARDVARVAAEFGELMAAIEAAIADGMITARDLALFDDKFNDLLAGAVALRADLAAKMPKPAHLKVAG